MTLEEIKNIYPPEANIGRWEDLTDQKFGLLKPLYVIKRDLWRRKRTTWLCQCDCGKFTTVTADNLKSNNVKSCGCLRVERTRNWGRGRIKKIPSGTQFGRLTVLERVEPPKNGYYYYLCKCKCGEKIEVRGTSLTYGHTTSCGCAHVGSNGEEKIAEILNLNNIFFKRQKSFEDCKNIRKLRFDFFIPELNRLIEFDGKQHFIKEGSGYYDKASLEAIKRNDNIKLSYALKSGYSLVRIPYTELNNIDLEMILGDKFLVKELEKENEI